MDGISFILKRFFYSFLSGCILIFFGIAYFSLLMHTSNVQPYFDITIINTYFIFVIVAILLSIIIEGICQVGLECYLNLFDIIKKINLKKSKTCKDRYILIKYKILECIFINPSILWVTQRYIEENKFNPLETFIKDSGLTKEKCLYFNSNLIYNAVYMCASIIERDGKINNIYHYRDNSYIIQMLRLSFFCITLTTFFSGIIFFILTKVNIWEFYSIKKCELFFILLLVIFILSIIIFGGLSAISRSFAKRFVREVGYTYEALRFNLPISKNNETIALVNVNE